MRQGVESDPSPTMLTVVVAVGPHQRTVRFCVIGQVSRASSCLLKEIPRTKHLTRYHVGHIQRDGKWATN